MENKSRDVSSFFSTFTGNMAYPYCDFRAASISIILKEVLLEEIDV